MTIARLLIVPILAWCVMTSAWAADTQPAPVTPSAATRPARAARPTMPASLGAAMRDMGTVLKSLKAEAADPEKMEQSLRDVATMERDAAISKTLLPPTVTRAVADEKATKAESYRTEMVSLMKSLLDLEDAIAAKNTDSIKKSFDTIEAVMNKGHDEFIPKN